MGKMMQLRRFLQAIAAGALIAGFPTEAGAAPPYTGTGFIAPDLITDSDPTTFLTLTDAGRGMRTVFDRRVDAFISMNAYLFSATYSNGAAIEIQVNPEYGNTAAAREPAAFYAPVIGRIPAALRRDVDAVWIHRGDEAFGGGNRSILIHTGSIADDYIQSGTLEEILAHEAAHTSLDADLSAAPVWVAAQAADGEFISTYAQRNYIGEDVAESLVPYLIVCCGATRAPTGMVDTIRATIPHRLAVFEALGMDLSPMVGRDLIFEDDFDD